MRLHVCRRALRVFASGALTRLISVLALSLASRCVFHPLNVSLFLFGSACALRASGHPGRDGERNKKADGGSG